MKTAIKIKPSRRSLGKSTSSRVKTKAFMNKLGIKQARKASPKSKLMSVKKLADTKTHVDRHQVISASSGNQYTVSKIRSSGEGVCNCMGFATWRRCKHVRTVFGM